MSDVTEEMIAADDQKDKILTLEEYHQIIGLIAIEENAQQVARDARRAIRDLLDEDIDIVFVDRAIDLTSSPQEFIKRMYYTVDFRKGS